MQNVFKKIMCVVVVVTMLSASCVHASWTDWLPSWLTPQKVLIATGLGALACAGYYYWCCSSATRTKKQNKKKTDRTSHTTGDASAPCSSSSAARATDTFAERSVAVVGTHGQSRELGYVPTEAEKEAEKNAQLFARALEYAHKNQVHDFRSLLKDNPYILFLKDSTGQTVLMHVLQKFDRNFVPNASDNGTAFNIVDTDGRTALMHVITAVKPGLQNDAVTYIRDLIEKRSCDVLATDNDGNTMLHYAAQTGCVPLVKLIATKMFEKNSSVDHLKVKNKSMTLHHESDSVFNFVAQHVDAAVMGRVRAKQMMKSTCVKNYYEVAAYLQNIYWHDGQLKEQRTTLENVVQELMKADRS